MHKNYYFRSVIIDALCAVGEAINMYGDGRALNMSPDKASNYIHWICAARHWCGMGWQATKRNPLNVSNLRLACQYIREAQRSMINANFDVLYPPTSPLYNQAY